MKAEHHGVPGQLNVLVLDVDSEVTSFGRHNRLCVGRDVATGKLVIREDLRDLPLSTEADRRRVALHPNRRVHPRGTRLVHESSEPYTGNLGECIEHTYLVVNRRPSANKES